MSKYKAVRVEFDGQRFDSKREAWRYVELRNLEREGRIANLRRQVPFVLAPGVRLQSETRARPAIRFVADFCFERDGAEVVEDVKGMDTPVSRLKRHLMATVHGIQVEVVK